MSAAKYFAAPESFRVRHKPPILRTGVLTKSTFTTANCARRLPHGRELPCKNPGTMARCLLTKYRDDHEHGIFTSSALAPALLPLGKTACLGGRRIPDHSRFRPAAPSDHDGPPPYFRSAAARSPQALSGQRKRGNRGISEERVLSF